MTCWGFGCNGLACRAGRVCASAAQAAQSASSPIMLDAQSMLHPAQRLLCVGAPEPTVPRARLSPAQSTGDSRTSHTASAAQHDMSGLRLQWLGLQSWQCSCQRMRPTAKPVLCNSPELAVPRTFQACSAHGNFKSSHTEQAQHNVTFRRTAEDVCLQSWQRACQRCAGCLLSNDACHARRTKHVNHCTAPALCMSPRACCALSKPQPRSEDGQSSYHDRTSAVQHTGRCSNSFGCRSEASLLGVLPALRRCRPHHMHSACSVYKPLSLQCPECALALLRAREVQGHQDRESAV